MDDFTVSSLTESRNEYSMLFITKVAPIIAHGFESMFEDTIQLCKDNDEEEKYLMAFQNFLARVPKWNKTIIENEVNRIKEESNCEYLGDLLTCVHVTQLKILTNVRVGQKQKKLELEVPQLDVFIHKVYIECARKLYKNVFLFETDIMPIQKQKYKRDIDNLIRESITDVIRMNMPIENILKAYLDETCEQDIYEDVEESFENIGETLPDSVIQNDITTLEGGSKTAGTNTLPETTPIETFKTIDKEKERELEMGKVENSVVSQVDTKLNSQDTSIGKIPISVPSKTKQNISESVPVETPIPTQTQSPKKGVQFIGDFKENEPSGYESSASDGSSMYASDPEAEADDELDGYASDNSESSFKLKIGDDDNKVNVLGDVTDLGNNTSTSTSTSATASGNNSSNEIKLEFEELK